MPKKTSLIAIGSAKFLKLQAKWYKKVERSGHVDVERYTDMNKLPVSTMPRLHGSFIYDPETEELSDEAEFVPLADTDKASFWREIGRYAATMQPTHKDYRLIRIFAEAGSMAVAARDCGLTRNVGERRIKNWLRSHGLKEFTGLSRGRHEPAPEPGPVKRLSAEEIVRLDIKPPRSW